MGGVWDYVLRLDDRKGGFVGRLLSHTPKEPTLWVRRMTTDVERPLLGVQTGDYIEARLVDGTFRLFSILKSNADLITQFRVLVGLEILYWLGKVIFDEVEEGAVVLLLHPGVAHDEGAVCCDRSGRLIERGLILAGCGTAQD